MKVAFFSTRSYDREFFELLNTSDSIEIEYFEIPLEKRTAYLTKGFDAVCIFVNDRIDHETLEELSENGVGLIALRCAGFNNVDVSAAGEMGIKVMRVPAYSPEAVAEHAAALLLTLSRKTHKAYNRVREGNFSLEKIMGFNINGKVVGVVGTGNIGIAFCKIMLGFGCRILAFDIKENEELKNEGVEYHDLNTLFQQSDIISLHCPLVAETHYLINQKNIDKMKDGVCIINTSRGGLINTLDIIKGLKSKKIGALGIDVYEQEEKLFFSDYSEDIIEDDQIARLMTFPNVLITGHQGFFTREAMSQITKITLKNVLDFSKGVPSENEVTFS